MCYFYLPEKLLKNNILGLSALFCGPLTGIENQTRGKYADIQGAGKNTGATRFLLVFPPGI